MKPIRTKCQQLDRKPRRQIKVQTTLYKLMETVIDVVDTDEIKLINEVTLKLLAKANPKVCVTNH